MIRWNHKYVVVTSSWNHWWRHIWFMCKLYLFINRLSRLYRWWICDSENLGWGVIFWVWTLLRFWFRLFVFRFWNRFENIIFAQAFLFQILIKNVHSLIDRARRLVWIESCNQQWQSPTSVTNIDGVDEPVQFDFSTFIRLEPWESSWLKITGLWTLSACFLISSKIEATSWSCFAGLDSWSRIAAPNFVFFSFFAEFGSFQFISINFYFDDLRFLNPGRLVLIGMNFELISEDIFFVFRATVILVGIVAKFIFLGINNISSAIIWLFNPAVIIVAGVVVSIFDTVVDSNSTCRSTSDITIFGLPVRCCCPT